MSFQKQFLTILLLIILVSCSDEASGLQENPPPENKEVPKSGKKELQSLVLEYNDKEYLTNITNTSITNTKEIIFLAEQVLVKSFEISENASANITTGQAFILDQSPFTITITAEDGTAKDYTLTLTQDKGLQITSSQNIEDGSSYTTQSSDVYIDGAQMTKDFGRFHLTAYADFNNDGNTDVLISSGLFQSYEYSPIKLFLGDGTGFDADYCECGGACSGYSCTSFTERPNALPNNYQGMQHPRKILTGDYNGDNLIDAFIIGHGYDAPPFPGESPILLINNGDGFDYQKISNISGFFHGGSSADFDNDGDLDIFINGAPSAIESIFLINDGSGNFSPTSEFIDEEFHQNTNYYTSEFIDVNSDGFIDLLIGGHEHQGALTLVLWGNSSGKYYKDLSSEIPQVDGYHIVVDMDAADIDNDGDKDLIINRVDSNNFYQNYYVQILKNEGDQSFTDSTTSSISDNSGSEWYVWVRVQDLNNDGNLDIYLENDHLNNRKWYGNGDGTFN